MTLFFGLATVRWQKDTSLLVYEVETYYLKVYCILLKLVAYHLAVTSLKRAENCQELRGITFWFQFISGLSLSLFCLPFIYFLVNYQIITYFGFLPICLLRLLQLLLLLLAVYFHFPVVRALFYFFLVFFFCFEQFNFIVSLVFMAILSSFGG